MAEMAGDYCHWCLYRVVCVQICWGISPKGEENRVRLMLISGAKYCVPKDLSMHLIPPCLAGHFVNSDNRTGTLY